MSFYCSNLFNAVEMRTEKCFLETYKRFITVIFLELLWLIILENVLLENRVSFANIKLDIVIVYFPRLQQAIILLAFMVSERIKLSLRRSQCKQRPRIANNRYNKSNGMQELYSINNQQVPSFIYTIRYKKYSPIYSQLYINLRCFS